MVCQIINHYPFRLQTLIVIPEIIKELGTPKIGKINLINERRHKQIAYFASDFLSVPLPLITINSRKFYEVKTCYDA